VEPTPVDPSSRDAVDIEMRLESGILDLKLKI
jgi:hypothetical protein